MPLKISSLLLKLESVSRRKKYNEMAAVVPIHISNIKVTHLLFFNSLVICIKYSMHTSVIITERDKDKTANTQRIQKYLPQILFLVYDFKKSIRHEIFNICSPRKLVSVYAMLLNLNE